MMKYGDGVIMNYYFTIEDKLEFITIRDQRYSRVVSLQGTLFYLGSGSLAKVIICFVGVLVFRAELDFDMNHQ